MDELMRYHVGQTMLKQTRKTMLTGQYCNQNTFGYWLHDGDIMLWSWTRRY